MLGTSIKASQSTVQRSKAEIAASEAAIIAHRPQEALSRMDALLTEFPKLAKAHLVRADALMAMREVDLSLAALGQATKFAPKSEELWARFITDLHRAGHKGRARRIADKAPLKGPASKRLKTLAKDGPNLATTSLGDVPTERVHDVRRAIEAGALGKARELLEPLITTWPEVAFLYNMRGIIEMDVRHYAAAEADFRKALGLSPEFAEAKANLGASLSRQHRANEAIEVLGAAFEENPLNQAAKLNFADALFQAGRDTESRILAEEMLAKNPNDYDVLAHLARIYGKKGEHQKVVDTIQKIWNAKGYDPDQLQNFLTSVDYLEGINAALKVLDHIEESEETIRIKSLFLGRAGRLDEAIAIAHDQIEKQPSVTANYRRLGLLRKWQANDPLIDQMRKLDKDASIPGRSQVDLGYALSKSLEDIGEYKEAFAAISKANRIQKLELGDRKQRAAERNQFIARMWDKDTIQGLKRSNAPAVKCVFVVGMPRTGSSLTEAIIGRHPMVYDLGEDQFTITSVSRFLKPTQNNITELAKLLGDHLRTRSRGHPVVTDKHLGNATYIGPLSAALPNAKFVLVRRNPRAICLSIFQNRFNTFGHAYAMDLEDLAHHYVAFDQLMTHWKSVMGPELIEVRYEDLVTDPDYQTRKLIADLDLLWDEACLSPEKSTSAVRTLSIGQVRQGVYDSSRDRWRNYEEELQPLIKILEQHGL